MLLAGGLDSADDDEARALVKTHRGCGTGFDLSHHRAVTGALRSLDERREQASAETAPSRGGREVDRILHSTGVPLVSLPGGSDGEAEYLAIDPRSHEGGATGDLRGEPGERLSLRLLPGGPDGQRVSDGGVADGPDAGGIGCGGGPNRSGDGVEITYGATLFHRHSAQTTPIMYIMSFQLSVAPALRPVDTPTPTRRDRVV